MGMARTGDRIRYEPTRMRTAEIDFRCRYPQFDQDGALAELRRSEYARLDQGGQIYLDYTGGGLHALSQVRTHQTLLRDQVLGNPHSNSPASFAATALVDQTREAVRRFFNVSPEEYLCIFTANASSALRLVGESYPFGSGSTFALSADNHNSVNGIREFARRAGAKVVYVPVTAPDLRLDQNAVRRVLKSAGSGSHNLLAFPAQSNFSGVQHGLDLIHEARVAGWDVLVDVAAFVPTNRFDAARARPDFAALSFYKIMGFPTGIGCLLIRRERFDILARPWFSGGTVTIASVRGDGHYLRSDEAAFEDGTLDYLNLPAVKVGLQYINRVGMDTIHDRVLCLTGWLLDALQGLRHGNGRRLVKSTGRCTSEGRGGTLAFSMYDRDGRPIDDLRVEELGGRANISLRTGCFCNPGAGETALQLSERRLRKWFGHASPVTYAQFRDHIHLEQGRSPSAIRISLGVATNFADVYRFACFLQRFVDGTVAQIGHQAFFVRGPSGPGRRSRPPP